MGVPQPELVSEWMSEILLLKTKTWQLSKETRSKRVSLHQQLGWPSSIFLCLRSIDFSYSYPPSVPNCYWSQSDVKKNWWRRVNSALLCTTGIQVTATQLTKIKRSLFCHQERINVSFWSLMLQSRECQKLLVLFSVENLVSWLQEWDIQGNAARLAQL